MKKAISNSVWSLANQLTRVGSLALVTIALSRHFGPERFGSLVVALAFVRIFAVVATFGLDRILVRHIVDQEPNASAIVREAFWLKLGTAGLSYIAVVGLIATIQRGETLVLAIASIAGGGLLFQACDVFDYAFQARDRFSLTFLGRGVPILLSTILKLAAILVNAPLLAFAVLETIEAAFIGITLSILYRRTISPTPMSIPPAPVRWPRLLGEGLPLVLGALAIMIYMRSNVILLGKMIGYQSAGIYAAAAQISEGCTLIPVALLPALFPMFVHWRRTGPEAYHRKFERLFLGAVAAGLFFSLGLTFGGSTIVWLLFGADYLAAAGVLAVHGWTLIFIFIAITQSGYDVTEGLTWFATMRLFAGAALNIVLNICFIPRLGIVAIRRRNIDRPNFFGRVAERSSSANPTDSAHAVDVDLDLAGVADNGAGSSIRRRSRMVAGLTTTVAVIIFNRPDQITLL